MTTWTRLHVRIAVVALVAAATVAGAVAALVVVSGVYDVSASAQHTTPIYKMLESTLRYSVQRRARRHDEPALDAPAMRERGMQCFRVHCADCHGAPGVAPVHVALGMQPLPQPLTNAARAWRPRELFWIADNGIKMSGMPAFGTHVAGADLWAIVAFLQELPNLSPTDYATRARSTPRCERAAQTHVDEPDPNAAAVLRLRAYGCHGCHTIPGVTGPSDVIATTLAGFGSRGSIAGRWPLDEARLVEWIRFPKVLDPRTAMPDLGVTEPDARLIARYLLELK